MSIGGNENRQPFIQEDDSWRPIAHAASLDSPEILDMLLMNGFINTDHHLS